MYLLQQEDIEESARAELWREELIEEIEQKVGGLRELEEAGLGKKEQLVKWLLPLFFPINYIIGLNTVKGTRLSLCIKDPLKFPFV